MISLGLLFRQAKACKTCKGGCALYLYTLENKFTRHRRKADWFNPTERYRPGKDRDSKFRSRLTEARMARKYGG